MRYLNTKPGSIEEVAANMSKYAAESEYQDMFKKELEKAGKGIGAMTPAEKKAFFNKIDSKYKAKDEAVNEGITEPNGRISQKNKDLLKVNNYITVKGKVYVIDKVSLKDGVYTMKAFDENGKMHTISSKDVDSVEHWKASLKVASFDPKNEETINENVSQVQVKRDGKGNFNLTFKGKEIGYYHKSGSKYMVYYDNEDGDYNQSDEVSSEMQAKKLAYDNMNEKVDNPYAVGMAAAMKQKGDQPPLKKSTITKAHDIAKSIEKDQKEEVKESDTYDNNRYMMKKYGGQILARPDNSNTKDGKDHVYAPNVKIAKQLYSQGKKVYKEEDYTKKDVDKFHTSLDKLVHKSFGHSSDEKKKEMKNETHSFVTNKQNEKQKKADGEKDIVDPAPEMKKESLYDSIKSVWQMSAEQLEKIKSEAKYYKKEQNKNDLKSKKVADTGSETTPVDTEPKVDYTN